MAKSIRPANSAALLSAFLALLGLGLVLCSSAPRAQMGTGQPAADLGVLTPFYRSTQLQGHLTGMGLADIPDYLLGADVDLRYHRKPGFTQEIPFVDSFSITRFLGGYREDWVRKAAMDGAADVRSFDYAVRDGQGGLKYRPELLKQRLAPYIDAGYRPADITLSLSNVPWDLAASPRDATWGQVEPPSNLQEWSDLVRHVASDLKDYLGPSAAALSFKTCVECDTRVSFDGDAGEFFAYFAATEKGLHAVLPGAVLTPGEFTGTGSCGPEVKGCVYSTADFLAFANNHRLPISYVPRSLHAFRDFGPQMPSAVVARAVQSYAPLGGVSAEIPQFGILHEPFSKQDAADPAALQASWQFQTLMRLWGTIKPRRVFHWGGFTNVQKHMILNGAGFLRLALDQYLGDHARILASTEDPGSAAANAELMAVGFAGQSASAVIVSSFSPDPAGPARNVSIELSPDVLPGTAPLRTIHYRQSDNVFSAIRADLVADGNLNPDFASCASCLGPPLDMAADADRARMLIARNWQRYTELMKKNLRWVSNDPAVSRSGRTLHARLEPDELLLVD